MIDITNAVFASLSLILIILVWSDAYFYKIGDKIIGIYFLIMSIFALILAFTMSYSS